MYMHAYTGILRGHWELFVLNILDNILRVSYTFILCSYSGLRTYVRTFLFNVDACMIHSHSQNRILAYLDYIRCTVVRQHTHVPHIPHLRGEIRREITERRNMLHVLPHITFIGRSLNCPERQYPTTHPNPLESYQACSFSSTPVSGLPVEM